MARKKNGEVGISNVDLPEKEAAKSKPEIPVVLVEGDLVRRFNEAKAKAKELDETVKTLRGPLLEQGLNAVFSHNVAVPDKTISSVILQEAEPPEDYDPEGKVIEKRAEQAMFTWSTATLKFKLPEVQEFLKDPGYWQTKTPLDPNDYVKWGVAAKFDTGIFLKDGKFNRERYDKVRAALDAVAVELESPNPLDCYKEPVVVENAHERRWKELTYTGNVELSGVMPTTLKLEPVVPKP